MGRNVDELIAGLPKARRLKVEAKSQQLAREMIDHADSLGEIRKAFCKTLRFGLPQPRLVFDNPG